MQDSTVLPDLRILPTDKLLPHEEIDPRRVERLSVRLREEGVQKNPPVVTGIPGSNAYVVLDGASRSMAFARMGVPHIVAQLVSYSGPGVTLDTWYHVVCGLDEAEFESGLACVAGLRLETSSLGAARRCLEERRIAAYIVCADGVRIARSSEDADGPMLQGTRLLRRLVGAYSGRADIYRASNDVWEKQAPYYPAMTAVVIFPRLSPADILSAAVSGELVPAGITRHIIQARALNINIPFEVLEADWPQEQKDAWLQTWLMERMAANAIRYYSESTFSFNE